MKSLRLAAALALISLTGFVPTHFGFYYPLKWCVGSDGPLAVTDGSTVHIGHVNKDYSSIDLENGSQLVVDPGSGWVNICVSGNVTITTGATIVADNSESIWGTDYLGLGEYLSNVAPDLSLHQNLYFANFGGDGGESGNAVQGGLGSTSPSGGGGGGPAFDGTVLAGGDGYQGSSCDSGSNQQGLGGLAPGLPGTNALDFSCTGFLGTQTGPGGGGGAWGYNGGAVYLKVLGTLTVDAGVVAFSSNGQDGGIGGDGATISTVGGAAYGGGGGGGGSGGDGGTFVIAYHAGSADATNVSVNHGLGAIGGAGAFASTGSGVDGGTGNDGQDGSSNFSTF
jgi:hypothetical protein